MTNVEAVRPAPDAGVASRRAWLGLGVLVLPVLLVSMDVSVLFLALPTLTVDLDPSASEQLWILDIYGFLIAGLLITMGNLGDRIGRRRILLAGATVFGIASAMAAFAPSAGVLIAARALMGIGGATLLPSSLSLISTLFADAKQRATAIGVWTAFFAGGSAVGPIIGGVLLHHFWWGSVFLINVPVLLILLALAPVLLPEHRASSLGPLDLPSVALSIGGILPLVYAVKHAAEHGPDAEAAVIGLIGAVVLTLFVRRQRHLAEPLLDLGLFGRGQFSVAIGSSLAGMMSLAAMSYLASIYLQSVTGRDPLVAALLGIPMAIAVFLFSMTGCGGGPPVRRADHLRGGVDRRGRRQSDAARRRRGRRAGVVHRRLRDRGHRLRHHLHAGVGGGGVVGAAGARGFGGWHLGDQFRARQCAGPGATRLAGGGGVPVGREFRIDAGGDAGTGR